MSGFIFILNKNSEPVSNHLMHTFIDSLHTKGPDRQSIYLDENIGMGHTLFKTTFESEYDRQPVSLDKKTWIVSSARIDGRDELARKLNLSNNIDINKVDDSELILYAYRFWGEECTKHLMGDFAFVIWDKQKKKVFCAKDQLGMRQLYYAEKNNLLIISNSLNTITLHPKITKELNKKSIGGFLLFGDQAFLDKSITVFKDIKKVMPAHYLTYNIKNNVLNMKNYWMPSGKGKILNYKNESDYLEHFNELFELSVKDRIRTSSISIAMSGGMDSTSIAATAVKLKEENSYKLKLQAVTSVYDKIHLSEERYYAKLVAEKLNIPIHYLRGDNYKILNPYVVTTQPMEMVTPVYWLDFQKTMLNHSKVYLNADSADNLLSFTPPFYSEKKIGLGDFFHQMMKMRFVYGQFPSIGLGIKSKFKNNTISYDGYPTWINPEFEKLENLRDEWHAFKMRTMMKSHPINPIAQNWVMLPEWSSDDTLMYPVETLPEARDPFLDIRLIEFILSIPSLPWLYKKHILRKSMVGKLPKSIIKRPKTPLGDIETSLIMKIDNQWIKNWKPSKIVEEFIELNNFRSLSELENNKSHYFGTRALYLETWLSHLN